MWAPAIAFAQEKTPPLSSELSTAIRDGDIARVSALVDGGPDINARDADGNTPLILSAFYARAECVDLLLKKGADPNLANKVGVTALIRGATDPRKVQLLLRAGAKPQARTALGNTALILAARRYGNSAAVKFLLENGANALERNEAGVSPIMAAAASGDLENVRMLLDQGADPNDFPNPLKAHPLMPGGRTPLMWAAFRNDVPMMRLLLERGADPNRPSPFGTPLSQACWHDSLEAAQLLIDRGAKVDARDGLADYTALHWAASTDSPRPDLVKLLLAHGADPNAAGGDPVDAFMAVPQTPLMLASKRGNTAIVQTLIAAGAKGAPSPMPLPSPSRLIPPQIDQAMLREAAERAIVPLQISAAKSPTYFVRQANKQECVSCHQQYLPMAAVGNARQKSLRLDDSAARQQIELLHQNSATPHNIFDEREFIAQTLYHPDPAFTRGYELFAMAAEHVPPSFESDAMVHHLATIQAADGRWIINLPRPPIQSGDVAATALAIQSLKNYGWKGRSGEFAACIDRGRQWLWTVHPQTNEEFVFQILGLHWAGEPADKLSNAVKGLIDRQREDGGWSQLPTLSSDAYATGEALYTLATAGKISVNDPAWQRGLRFLLATQHDDGTWYAARRAFPFQPTMPSGFPHGRDGWLSSAATSWAVMAITQAIKPAAVIAPPREWTHTVAAATPRYSAEPAAAVDFVKQIKPILERSCVECHGAQRQRSHYRVDSREALLKGGNSGDAAVVPGHSEQSPLIQYVSGPGADLEMPPTDKRHRFQPLNTQEVQLLRAWVDQNAPWPDEAKLKSQQ